MHEKDNCTIVFTDTIIALSVFLFIFMCVWWGRGGLDAEVEDCNAMMLGFFLADSDIFFFFPF